MIYRIRHAIEYKYDAPVVLSPHTLRVHVTPAPGLRILERRLDVKPAPAGQTQGIGICGNFEEILWFEGRTSELSILCETKVETFPVNVFDFIMQPGCERIPIAASGSLATLLKPFLASESPSADIRAFASAIAKQADFFAPAFAAGLCAAIHRRFPCGRRPEGDARPAVETWALGEGACRDLAVLFMAAARTQGLPARFVSGYFEGTPDAPEHDLHAWAEVYFPGGGWRGFDPTTGFGVTDSHLPVAAAPEADLATPVEGAYHGSAGAILDAQVSMTRDAG